MKNKTTQSTSPIFKSILNKKWQQRGFDERLALTIFQKFNLSQFLANSLAAKNIQLEEIEDFLSPSIKSALPDPFSLKDMEVAAKKVVQSIKNREKITVFGDYDVDGATSSALLKRFICEASGPGNKICEIYIPDRILEGYGPNSKALIELKNTGTKLVITVDCGTTAFTPLEDAAKEGLDVIVIDHHLGALEKPKALAVVNPNRLDETFPHKNLAGVGVTFLLVVAVNKLLREENYYQSNNVQEPKLLAYLDLVALGTVCDVVSLSGINRSFVAQGLKVIQSRNNPGIRSLCDISNLSEPCSAYHLGFVIGPRINAGGRVGKSDLGATILSSNNESEIKKIANDLDTFNRQRKDIESTVLEEALSQVKKNKNHQKPVIFAYSTGWHPGVIGIVASRIKEEFNKPTAIISLDGELGKASCRSINGVDFGSAIIKARTNEMIIEGGGHAMAAGFSVQKDKIEELHSFLCAELEEPVKQANENNIHHFYDLLDSTSANLKLAKEISKLEPYGAGNSRPKFLIQNLQIVEASQIGKDRSHVRCVFSNKELTGWQGRINAVCFKAMANKIGPILISKNKGQPINIIGQLNINYWMGNENLQILIEDIV